MRSSLPRASRATLVLAAGLTGLVILAGCGDDGTVTQLPSALAIETDSDSGAPTTTAASAGATSSAGATASVETRPEILLLGGPQLDGQQFDLASTAGKDVLLWFWAPW